MAGHNIPSATAEHGLEACRRQLHRFLARRIRDRQEVRDMVQEVYVRFLQTPRRTMVQEPLAYLYRVAANLIHDQYERKHGALVTFDSELVDELGEHPLDLQRDELGEQFSAERHLEEVLAQLPGIYQSVLLLRKRDGLSFDEIAKELNISKHTAEKYLYRAIAQFKAADWSQP